MDELIKTVTEKAGISGDQAKHAVEAVMGFLKDKLPGGIGGQIEGLMSGEGGGLGDIMGKLGGLKDMLGGK